jgi:hypothetical protein
MRLPVRVVLPLLVVVDDGMLAMTVDRMTSGDTPRVPGAQPVSDRTDAAAIAPTRVIEGVIMPGAEADLTPGAPETATTCWAMS